LRATSDISAPAIFRRAFFFLGVLASGLPAAPANAPQPPLAQIGKPDAAEAARILEQFRRSGVVGDYFFEFELRQLPRRGEETVFRGRLWGGRNDQGAVERVVLFDRDGRERRLLIQHGAQAGVWRLIERRAEQLPVAALFEPLVPGVELTPFDLQMPFLYWPGATVESIARMRGRPAHEFIFRPPPEFAAKHAQLGGVRSYFDTQFNVPVQTELLSPGRAVTKTMSLLDLKKVGEQWIPKSFEVRNENSRDKTRLLVTGAALNLTLPPAVFTPVALADDLRPPGSAQIVPLAP
jgi:hypothetical protein